MQAAIANAQVDDLSGSHGYGPFQPGMFRGIVLHVNQGDTTPEWYASQFDVCPNFQVASDGTVYQLLPPMNQPWCQSAGNQYYAAIETSGFSGQPFTAEQIESIAHIIAWYKQNTSFKLQLANVPGDYGLGYHGMGGDAWGGHPNCPGQPRIDARGQILARATFLVNPPATNGDDFPMDQPTFNRMMDTYFVGTGRARIIQGVNEGDKESALVIDAPVLAAVNALSAKLDKIITKIGA